MLFFEPRYHLSYLYPTRTTVRGLGSRASSPTPRRVPPVNTADTKGGVGSDAAFSAEKAAPGVDRKFSPRECSGSPKRRAFRNLQQDSRSTESIKPQSDFGADSGSGSGSGSGRCGGGGGDDGEDGGSVDGSDGEIGEGESASTSSSLSPPPSPPPSPPLSPPLVSVTLSLTVRRRSCGGRCCGLGSSSVSSTGSAGSSASVKTTVTVNGASQDANGPLSGESSRKRFTFFCIYPADWRAPHPRLEWPSGCGLPQGKMVRI
ncbi:Protein of unknown function [Gryllus bimaculatus]|nr:Protein of unknown function [Gryllus bimaculatus]